MLKILLLLVLTVAVGTVPLLWATGLLSGWGVVYVALAIWTLGVVTVAASSKA